MPIESDSSLVDYAKTLDCIHCGLCLPTCPTYVLTGVETSSPRGRIHLMRAAAEGRIESDADFAEEMDFCLLCRHCESVCPAGVQFAAMMEHTRGALEDRHERGRMARFARWLGFRQLLPRKGALALSLGALRVAQRTGLTRLFGGLAKRVGIDVDTLPAVPSGRDRRRLLPTTPAHADKRGEVQMLEGCVMPGLFGRVNRATANSLARAGFDVAVPRAQTCCGSLHAHNGELEEARALAQKNIEAFGDGDTPIVVNSAGCASHMKELGALFQEDDPWHDRARSFAKRVRDYAEFLAPHIKSGDLQLDAGALPGPIAWDDPCHLCHGQGIRDEPRSILDSIEGLQQVELATPEACCGSAGIYSVLRPADSAAILEPKLADLQSSGAAVLVTANPGCHLQWETGLRRKGRKVRVMHLAELVDLAGR